MTTRIVRKPELAKRIVVVDGIPGCGKSMLSAVISSLERVELLKYSFEIEYFCALCHLGLIDAQTCTQMIRLQSDLIIYNLMMSREVNFRWNDLSSSFKSVHPSKYIWRALRAGDEAVPDQIEKEQPIMHLTTHSLLAASGPVFDALTQRLTFVKFHRHPLYMLKQNEWNMISLVRNPRHFTMYISGQDGVDVPFYCQGWEALFEASNPTERAIFFMERQRKSEYDFFRTFTHNDQLIELTFESFVKDPAPYIQEVCNHLGTTVSRHTKKILKREKIPRDVLGNGRNLPIYKRVGWQPSRFANSEDEAKDLRKHAYSRVSVEAREALDWLCDDYETLTKRILGSRRQNRIVFDLAASQKS